mmetsp:Transcript_128461/g.357605  ORF Transcript_128461/g.357605 Transcript_128461/m.357605 type:complete len:405 (-) Transcript_128461:273-1487(-)
MRVTPVLLLFVALPLRLAVRGSWLLTVLRQQRLRLGIGVLLVLSGLARLPARFETGWAAGRCRCTLSRNRAQRRAGGDCRGTAGGTACCPACIRGVGCLRCQERLRDCLLRKCQGVLLGSLPRARRLSLAGALATARSGLLTALLLLPLLLSHLLRDGLCKLHVVDEPLVLAMRTDVVLNGGLELAPQKIVHVVLLDVTVAGDVICPEGLLDGGRVVLHAPRLCMLDELAVVHLPRSAALLLERVRILARVVLVDDAIEELLLRRRDPQVEGLLQDLDEGPGVDLAGVLLVEALEALLKQHHVLLLPSEGGAVQLRQHAEGRPRDDVVLREFPHGLDHPVVDVHLQLGAGLGRRPTAGHGLALPLLDPLVVHRLRGSHALGRNLSEQGPHKVLGRLRDAIPATA